MMSFSQKMLQVFHLSFVITLISSLVHEPIDVVYTWVNGSDPMFRSQLEEFLEQVRHATVDSSRRRFDDRNELKFSLRSLERYAPWINHVYIVTNGQVPRWLNLDYDGVTLVTHEEIFVDKTNLPTFSSPAIEAHLHRIPGLSKRFIYFNDDFFLHSPVSLEDFVTSSGEFVIYLTGSLPDCAFRCPWSRVADGLCDPQCNNPNCQMDGGDCSLEDSATNYGRIQIKDNAEPYAESLHHTNRILNEHYGFTVRKVPAHAPIMIDREVMGEMQGKFGPLFDKTASNRIRMVDDIQFSFAYYHYLIHEKGGTASRWAKHNVKIISDAESAYVDFKMLNSDESNVIYHLNQIRKSTKKFVCLNDDLDRNWMYSNGQIEQIMLEFYTSLFPAPSRFELP